MTTSGHSVSVPLTATPQRDGNPLGHDPRSDPLSTSDRRAASWFVSVSRSGSSVTNSYPGSSPTAIDAALRRFAEVYPPHVYADAPDVVFVQADCGGVVVRGRYSLEMRRPLVRCEVSSCAADFFHVPARDFPALCLDHAEEARRAGLLFLDRSSGATCWYAPVAK